MQVLDVIARTCVDISPPCDGITKYQSAAPTTTTFAFGFLPSRGVV
jgi:hypothetical protein